MRKRWKIRGLSEKAYCSGQRLGLNPIIAQILLNRQIEDDDCRRFLNPEGNNLYSPFLLPDITVAVRRIKRAISNKEKIALFGDYDVDGITSLVIFYDYIKEESAKFSFYIPHRLKEGFGLNMEAIRRLKKEGVSLLICFDCGTNSFGEIELAKALGIDVIVVDHHQPKEGLNSPLAFINPKRADSHYPFSYLSSAALAFKLVQAIKEKDSFHLLDLVALSIVCDVVPLRGENRLLLKEGLKWLKQGMRTSLNVLCQASGIKPENIDTFHLGYILGPRINASGRVNTAHDALNMFLAQDIHLAKECAHKLNEHNRYRRDIEGGVLKEADDAIDRNCSASPAIIVYKQGWHYGILGIVASRLADKYYRPTFVIGFDKDKGRGSARSIANFNLMQALRYCEGYLSTYGGHNKAAGIEIFHKDVEGFKRKLNQVAEKMLSPGDFIPVLDIDLELEFKDINMGLAEDIQRLKPFGEGNNQPLFITKGIFVKQLPKKINNGLYRVWLSDGSLTYEGTFGSRDGLSEILIYGKKFDIVYSLEKNHYHNSIKMVLKDVRLN